jgi:hypothetical protein
VTPLNKTARRVTLETYGYGRNARKLVVAFERGDLITIREQGRRTKHTAKLVDVRWWMLRGQGEQSSPSGRPPPTRCRKAAFFSDE